MRILVTVAIVSAGLVGAAFASYKTAEPFFLKDGRSYTLSCYGSEPKGELHISTVDRGNMVDVTFEDQTFRLKFTGHFLFTDFYSDGSIALSLDPEGRLEGFPHGPAGLCAL